MGNQFVKPGVIEGFSGPMASGKSGALLRRVDPLRWVSGVSYIGFKPGVDTRGIGSRSGEDFIDWIYVSKASDILDYVKDSHDVVLIDEVQFFDEVIVDVVLKLQGDHKNVVFAGLDYDFRGEPFGSMKELMFRANELMKLYAVCSCGERAYYTQRLIDGKPASFDSSIVSIEGEGLKESYEPRCFGCHEVPGRR